MLTVPMPEKYETIAVAYSTRCSHQTMLLGEDCFELEKLERALKLFRARLARVLPKLDSNEARRSINDLQDGLADVLQDACFVELMEDARAAYDEAHVRLIRRVIREAHPIKLPAPEGEDVCPQCGMDLNELNTSKNAADRGERSCDRCELVKSCAEQ